MAMVRRKTGQTGDEAGQGADRAWRLALARAARDEMALSLEVTGLRDEKVSLAELVELLPDRSLLAVLDAAGDDGLGLFAVEPAILSGMIGMLATGRIAPPSEAPRRPTRTDAAMVAPLIDAALAGLADVLGGQPDLPWAEGWRYASFLDEARPLALLLEDTGFRLLRATVSLQGGAAAGQVLLALPAAVRARALAPPQDPGMAPEPEAFTRAFARQVEAVSCRIAVELTRVHLPLSQVMALGAGEVVPLGDATVARLVLRGIDGRILAEGKLGQMRGQRAVRLTPSPPDEALRIAG